MLYVDKLALASPDRGAHFPFWFRRIFGVPRMHGAAAFVREGRGVYKARHCYHDGNEYLYAVTSSGARLKKIVVLLPGVSEAHAVAWLEDLLDRMDPPQPMRPPLTLVKPTKPPVTTPPEFIEDALTAALRRASQAARAYPFRRLRD